MTTPPAADLAVSFTRDLILPKFNDGTQFSWDLTQGVETATWYRYFGDAPTSLPDKYTSLQVLSNGAALPVYFDLYDGNHLRVVLPSGALSLGMLMRAISDATKTVITPDNYLSLTGTAWDTTSTDVITLGRAVRDRAAFYSNQTPLLVALIADSAGGLVVAC